MHYSLQKTPRNWQSRIKEGLEVLGVKCWVLGFEFRFWVRLFIHPEIRPYNPKNKIRSTAYMFIHLNPKLKTQNSKLN